MTVTPPPAAPIAPKYHPGPPADDRADLASFGYAQELERSLGKFSSFAAGFSYISILTGVPQLFYLGFAAGGPAFFWTWPLVLAGQFLVALCFAELAGHYPLSGSVYQWSRRVGTPFVGWLAGWIYLACLFATLAAVALALQITLPQISSAFQLVGSPDRPRDVAANSVLLGCILIVFTTVVNSVGVKLLARINNAGVLAELLGLATLVTLLATHARRGPGVLFDSLGRGAASPHGYASDFLAAMLMASYVMYGFDTAGSLAEETSHPRRTVPRAILQALSTAGLAGALLLITALLAAADLRDPALSTAQGGLPLIVRQTLGPVVGTVLLVDMAFAVSVCALAVHTGAVRLLFAMSRDGTLPFSRLLARVAPSSHTPIVPAILVGVIAAAILLLNVNFEKIVGLVTSVAIVWANVGYLLVTAPLLACRLRGWRAAPGTFSLGRWGLLVNVAAVMWGVFIIINVGWPRASVYGETVGERYAAVWFTLAWVAVGCTYYLFVIRRRAKSLLGPSASPAA